MSSFQNESSGAVVDYYEKILNDIKLGITHGIAIAVVILIGAGIKLKFFSSDAKHKQAKAVLSSLGLKKLIPTLNKYELSIASQLVEPADIDVTFKNIGGLDKTVACIKSNIILPLLTYRFLKNRSCHLQPPKGVLLYGPPGCGKTLIAKATAKEANARFLNLEIPTLTDKWYGESQKFAHAVFTLAQKVQPCIIFIDEIDTFLRARSASDHEVTAMVKAQFMVLWDGLSSRENNGIVILGATNRPFDVDEAILRRMPTKLEVPKPGLEQRKNILKLFLDGENLDDVEKLAEGTDGFSGSDLKELCRDAISAPVREQETKILDFVRKDDEKGLDLFLDGLRSVRFDDFQAALQNFQHKENWDFRKTDVGDHCCSHK